MIKCSKCPVLMQSLSYQLEKTFGVFQTKSTNFVRIRLFIKQHKMYAKWRWQFTDETNCYSIDYPILSCFNLLYPSCLFFLSIFTSLNIAFHVKLSCFTWNLLFSCEISRLRSHCSFESGRKCCASFGQICPFFQVKIAALPDAVHPLGSLICQDTFQVRVRLLWLVIATLSLSSHKIGQSDPKNLWFHSIKTSINPV